MQALGLKSFYLSKGYNQKRVLQFDFKMQLNEFKCAAWLCYLLSKKEGVITKKLSVFCSDCEEDPFDFCEKHENQGFLIHTHDAEIPDFEIGTGSMHHLLFIEDVGYFLMLSETEMYKLSQIAKLARL